MFLLRLLGYSYFLPLLELILIIHVFLENSTSVEISTFVSAEQPCISKWFLASSLPYLWLYLLLIPRFISLIGLFK